MKDVEASEAAIAALAPSGTLRAAINLSNFLLVSEVGADGTPVGVSPDLSTALADRLGVPIELVTYANPGELADAVEEWDTGNIGAEPQRAERINFTSAYAEIEGTFVVPAGSHLGTFSEVDQPGNRIAVKERAAYCLWLERNLEHAQLVQTASHDEAFEVFVDQRLDALAGLRPRMMTDAGQLPGAVVLPGHFMTVQQAIGTPKDRDPAGIDYLVRFVEEAKANGLINDLIGKHAVNGLSVAPSARL